MKKYLSLNRTEQLLPAIASPPPLILNNPFTISVNNYNSSVGLTTNNSSGFSDTSKLLSAVAAVSNNQFIEAESSPLQSITTKTDNFCNIQSNLNSELQFTTNNSTSQPQHLSAAAAEYLLAAFASNNSQLVRSSTSSNQQQQNNNNFTTSFTNFNQFSDSNNQELQQQNATAALVAAIQQRQQEHNQEENFNTFNSLQEFDNRRSSVVQQFSPHSISQSGDSSLTNKLSNVCATAFASPNEGVTSGGKTTNSANNSSTQNVCSSSQIIFKANANNCSSIDQSSTGPSSLSGSSTSSNPSSVAAAFLNQHQSAFHLIPQQSQHSSLNSLFQQQLQQQNQEQTQPLNNFQQANTSSEQFALASSLSAGLPVTEHQQRAVPAGTTQAPSQPPQTPRALQQQPSPMNQAAAAAAALYPQLMCLPALLDRLGPHILRSHMSSSQFKPIPNNERVDLVRFRNKDPQDWVMDDVLAWILDVARRNQIPVENLNMHKFATCNGPRLLLMTEQNFQDRDPVYGSMLYNEFKKLVSEDTVIDEWMRTQYKDNEEEPQPCNSGNINNINNINTFEGTSQSTFQQSGQLHNNLNGLLNNQPISPLIQSTLSQQHVAAVAAAAQQFLQQPQNKSMNTLQQNQQLNAAHLLSAANKCQISGMPNNYNNRVDQSLHNVNMKIKKNKDGRPRKRSQHTKGNKLWEFIRDALKDPSTCPSVVRWEDPVEGVFRIVESEKLARLWGEKKNNTKMTYEKLSRAMRTYYEKQILVPVPKTGLYPKKLVYKFGPGAHGWSAPPQMVAASLQLDQLENASNC